MGTRRQFSREFKVENRPDVVLIDASIGTKVSASKATESKFPLPSN